MPAWRSAAARLEVLLPRRMPGPTSWIALLARLPLLICAVIIATLLSLTPAVADQPHLACDRAAARAERAWSLPAGLLAAIGTVESGRPDPAGSHRRAWPWSINAEGWSHFAANKTDAISTVRLLQARGYRLIDVGCFQVDLFYHPRAFTSLDEAFEPDANAQAASRILSRARFASTAWEPAIAAYHSASLLRGARYLQRVLAVWPAARTRLAVLEMTPSMLPGYAVLLSPQARLVRTVTAADPAPAAVAGLPRVVTPSEVPAQTRLIDATDALPRNLSPDVAPRLPRRF